MAIPGPVALAKWALAEGCPWRNEFYRHVAPANQSNGEYGYEYGSDDDE